MNLYPYQEIYGFLIDQLYFVPSITGFGITFTILNLMVYIIMRINETYRKIKEAVKTILELPVIVPSMVVLRKDNRF